MAEAIGEVMQPTTDRAWDSIAYLPTVPDIERVRHRREDFC
jgi:hypothetical protein